MCEIEKTSRDLHSIKLWGFMSMLQSDDLDLSDDRIFKILIKDAIEYCDVRPGELATEFGVNLSTVSRWVTGKSSPHPMIRPHIIKWIERKMRPIARGVNISPEVFEEMNARVQKTRRQVELDDVA